MGERQIIPLSEHQQKYRPCPKCMGAPNVLLKTEDAIPYLICTVCKHEWYPTPIDIKWKHEHNYCLVLHLSEIAYMDHAILSLINMCECSANRSEHKIPLCSGCEILSNLRRRIHDTGFLTQTPHMEYYTRYIHENRHQNIMNEKTEGGG